MIVDLTQPDPVGSVVIDLTDDTRSAEEAVAAAQAGNRAVTCAKVAQRLVIGMQPLPSQPIQWAQDSETEDDSEGEADDEPPTKRARLQGPTTKRARRTPEECWAQFGLSTDKVYVAMVGGMTPRKHPCRVRMHNGVLQWRKERMEDRWMGKGHFFMQHEPQDLCFANVPLKSDIFVLRKDAMYVQCENVISLSIPRVQHA